MPIAGAGFRSLVIGLIILASAAGGCADSGGASITPAPATPPMSTVESTTVPVSSPSAAKPIIPTTVATATTVPSPTPSMTKVKVYYSRSSATDIEFVPVERTIPKTAAIGRAAIEELLKGPTPEEEAQGLDNPIPSNARLLSLKIVDGVAYADFDEALQFGVGGSVRTMAIRKMITLTLMQFSTVKEVIISIEGRTEDILQP
mgnify:CR=1 FL=1